MSLAALRDRYAIERELGRGGMATVYLAHDLRHQSKVPIKVLRPELAARESSASSPIFEPPPTSTTHTFFPCWIPTVPVAALRRAAVCLVQDEAPSEQSRALAQYDQVSHRVSRAVAHMEGSLFHHGMGEGFGKIHPQKDAKPHKL